MSDYLALFTQYLKIDSPKKGNELSSVFCPFHEDKKTKSAGINLHTGVFNCQKCGSLSPLKFIAKFNDLDLTQAEIILDNYRKENNIQENKENWSKKFHIVKESSEARELYIKSKEIPLNKIPAILEYCESKGFDLQTLIDADCGFLSAEDTHTQKNAITFPYWYGGKVLTLRYRHTSDGSKNGLEDHEMCLWGINSIPEDATKLVICEGESDRLILMYLFRVWEVNDIYVVSSPGTFFKTEWCRDLNGFETIVVIDDADSDGKLFQAVRKCSSKAIHFELPWQRQQLGKDICEWCVDNDPADLIKTIQGLFEKTKAFSKVLSFKNLVIAREEKKQTRIQHLLDCGQVGLVGGQKGQRKTWLLMNLVHSLINPGSNLFGISEFNSIGPAPKVLFIEAESSQAKFANRVEKVLQNCQEQAEEFTTWWHKPGIKLDNDSGVERLIEEIYRHEPEVLFLDVFQRLSTADENSATETGKVWDSILGLNNKFPTLSTIIAHHFGKDKTISDGWDAFRGSSRMVGEVDFGILIEDRPSKEGLGSRIRFLFRDEEPLLTNDGKDVWRFTFDPDTGMLDVDEETVGIDKSDDLVRETKKRKEWTLKEAMELFGVSDTAITNWVRKQQDKIVKTRGCKSSPSMIKYVGP